MQLWFGKELVLLKIELSSISSAEGRGDKAVSMVMVKLLLAVVVETYYISGEEEVLMYITLKVESNGMEREEGCS